MYGYRGGQRDQRSRPPCDGRLEDNSSLSSRRQDYFSQGEGVMNTAALSHYDDDETQRYIKAVNDGVKSAVSGNFYDYDEVREWLLSWGTERE